MNQWESWTRLMEEWGLFQSILFLPAYFLFDLKDQGKRLTNFVNELIKSEWVCGGFARFWLFDACISWTVVLRVSKNSKKYLGESSVPVPFHPKINLFCIKAWSCFASITFFFFFSFFCCIVTILSWQFNEKQTNNMLNKYFSIFNIGLIIFILTESCTWNAGRENMYIVAMN